MWQFFSHIWWFSYFFLTFGAFILILCSSNTTCDSSFLTFGGSLTFFSHLTVPSLHCGAPTLYVTIFFSRFVVHLPFLLILDDSILTLCNSNITHDYSFVTFGGSFIFLAFDGFILILCSFNIICNCSAVPTSHVTVLLSHLVVPLFFFSRLIIPLSHLTIPT